MAWTAPRTWTTGEVPTATIFNTHLRDNLVAVTDAVLVRRTTTQTGSPFDVSFDTEAFDDFSGWVVGSPTRITLPTAGRYEFIWWAVPVSGSDGDWACRVKRYNSGAVLQEDNVGGNSSVYTAPGSGAGIVVASAADFLVLNFTSGASGTRANCASASIYVKKAKA